jgi:hypothetical protein
MMAAHGYARQVNDRDMERWVKEIRFRAERGMGVLLKETEQTNQRRSKSAGRPKKVSSGNDSFSPKSLKQLGITKDQSSQYQQLAAIPEPEFERRIENMKRDPRGATTAKMLKPVPKQGVREPDRIKREDIWTDTFVWLGEVKRCASIEVLRKVKPTGAMTL